MARPHWNLMSERVAELLRFRGADQRRAGGGAPPSAASGPPSASSTSASAEASGAPRPGRPSHAQGAPAERAASRARTRTLGSAAAGQPMGHLALAARPPATRRGSSRRGSSGPCSTSRTRRPARGVLRDGWGHRRHGPSEAEAATESWLTRTPAAGSPDLTGDLRSWGAASRSAARKAHFPRVLDAPDVAEPGPGPSAPPARWRSTSGR
jgi:hypothetical protein